MFFAYGFIKSRKTNFWPTSNCRRLHKIAKSVYCLHNVSISAWNNSAPIARIVMKFYIWILFENMSRNFKFHSNLTSRMGTLHEDQYTLLTIPCSVLLGMRNFPDKLCRRNQNTFYFQKPFFFRKSLLLRDNVGKYSEPHMPHTKIWHKLIACYIPKATKSHSE